MRQINLGIIGTGWCGGIRAVTASRSPSCDELHLAEIDPARREEISAQTNPTVATDNWEEIVNNPDIDAVVVSATPGGPAPPDDEGGARRRVSTSCWRSRSR